MVQGWTYFKNKAKAGSFSGTDIDIGYERATSDIVSTRNNVSLELPRAVFAAKYKRPARE